MTTAATPTATAILILIIILVYTVHRGSRDNREASKRYTCEETNCTCTSILTMHLSQVDTVVCDMTREDKTETLQ